MPSVYSVSWQFPGFERLMSPAPGGLTSVSSEKQVLTNVGQWSEGPLEPAAMRRLFERIIDEARSVERASAKRED